MSTTVKLFSLFVISYLLLVIIPKAYAQTFCQPIYGGGQTCVTVGNVQINKTILNPGTNKMVDSLSISDPRFQPGFIVTFQITLTNIGSSNIARIRVSDIFPQYVSFSSGPGNFDGNTRTLTFDVLNLNPQETRVFTIIGRIVDTSSLPTNQQVICVVNQAIATNLDGVSQGSQDNSQLCIEKVIQQPTGFPVFPQAKIFTTPATGPEAWVLFSMVPLGAAGYFLRKKSMNNKIKPKGGER